MEPPSKKAKTSDNIKLKLLIEETFKNLTNEIDVEIETALMNLSNNEQKEIERLNEIRSNMIAEIESIQKYNLDNFENTETLEDSDEISIISQYILFNKYCVYLDSNVLNKVLGIKDSKHGILFTTNFYIEPSGVEKLKKIMDARSNYFTDKYSRYIIDQSFLYIALMIREFNCQFNNGYIIKVDSNQVKEINFSHQQQTPVQNLIDNFNNLKEFVIKVPKLSEVDKYLIKCENLEKLVMSSCNIEYIDIDAFSSLVNLKYLDISNNALNKLEKGIFDPLTKLEELDLSNCLRRFSKLDRKNEGLFQKLVNLKKMNLSKLDVEITNDLLAGLDSLVHLKLKGFKSLDNDFTNLISLESLELSDGVFNDNLADLEIKFPQNLKTIDFTLNWRNSLRHIDSIRNFSTIILKNTNKIQDDLFINNPDLEELNLGNTNLITSNHDHLPKLHTVRLDSVRLGSEQISFFSHLSSLKSIQFILCKYKDGIELNLLVISMKNIEKLRISVEDDNPMKRCRYHKAIKNTNDEFAEDCSLRNGKQVKYVHDIEKLNNDSNIWNGHSKLVELDLSGYTIQENIEFSFNGLVNLEKLNLNDNNLKRLHSKMFDGLKNLKWLSVVFCEITDISEDVFTADNQKLEHLDLSDNLIKQLPNKLFKELKSLKCLNLSTNCLTSLDKCVFSDLLNLEELDLSFNSIKSLDVNLFDGNPNLVSLDLRKLEVPEYVILKCITTIQDIEILKMQKPNDILSIIKFKNLKTLFTKRYKITKGEIEDNWEPENYKIFKDSFVLY